MKQYIEQNKDRFFEELFSLLRIPSISAKSENKADMKRCADRLVQLLLEAGADEAGVYPSKGNPVVYGQKIVDPSLKTVLVYGHYDVQPPEPSGGAVPMMTRVSCSCISRLSSSWSAAGS